MLTIPTPPVHRPAARHHGERGFGLLEVALALVVIAVATLGSVSWTLSGMSLEADNREMADAHDAMRQLFEELNALPIEQVFARCNDDPTDDPGGEGTSRGGVFTIEAERSEHFLDATYVVPLSVSYQRSAPLHVEIQFPVNADGKLVESMQTPAWGDQVWDLDGDGQISDVPLTGGYKLLPVHVRLEWKGSGGTRAIEHVRLLGVRIRPEASK